MAKEAEGRKAHVVGHNESDAAKSSGKKDYAKKPMKKKSSEVRNDSSSSSEKKQKKEDSTNKRVEKELRDEFTQPAKILEDEMKMDEKFPSEEPKNPELDKRSSRLVLYTILVVLGVVALIVVLSNIVETPETSYEYNGFTFERYGGDESWYTSIMVGDTVVPVPFHYGPRDLEDIPYEIDGDSLLESEFIYLSMPPMEGQGVDARRVGQAAIEVGKIIGTRNEIFNIPTRATLTHAADTDDPLETEDGRDIPIANCDNVSGNESVVMFGHGDRTGVFQDADNPSCYVVQGAEGRDVIRAANRMVYGLLGIMN